MLVTGQNIYTALLINKCAHMPDPGVPLGHLKELLSGVDPEQLRQVIPLVGGVITMMFTDIVDSTRVKHQVGDLPYFGAQSTQRRRPRVHRAARRP